MARVKGGTVSRARRKRVLKTCQRILWIKTHII